MTERAFCIDRSREDDAVGVDIEVKRHWMIGADSCRSDLLDAVSVLDLLSGPSHDGPS